MGRTFEITVPLGEDLPTCAPGETFDIYTERGVVSVVLVAIEGRRVVFRNRTLQ